MNCHICLASFFDSNMSCTYADGLSPYEHKGVLGVPEKFETPEKLKEKCNILTQWIKEAKFVVVHTGAGISTSAGIPDFRGPNGVWTLEEKGLKPEISISFTEAKPTYTHMALKKLVEENTVRYIVSQNIDGLHLKSGLKRENLAELHGNMFIEQCNVCKRQFVRSSPAPTVGQKPIGQNCHSGKTCGRSCRGKLHDIILDWEHSLPDDDLEMADLNSCIADLSICFGTTLQIVPSGNLPLNTLKYGGKLVICNLQPTKHDNKADLIINSYVDDVMQILMSNLNQEVREYSSNTDPTKSEDLIEWTICKKQLKLTKTLYKKQCDGVLKKRVLVKKSQKSTDSTNNVNKRIKLEKIIPKRKRKSNVLTNLNFIKDDTKEIPKKEVSEEKSHCLDLVLKDETIDDDIEQISDMNPIMIEKVIEEKEFVDSNSDKLVESC